MENKLLNRPDVRDLIEICKDRKIYIQTHNIPDPDAIGSAYGLQQLLLNFGISSTICYDGEIDKMSAAKILDMFGIEMFSDEDLSGVMEKDDYIICVDSQKHAGNITDLPGQEIAAIDHHPTTEENAHVTYMYKDVRMLGSCCTMIAQYYRDLDLTPSSDVATALLYGVKMDTLQFRRGITEDDISIFAYLNRLMDIDKLKCLEVNSIEFDDLKAYGAAINNIQVFDYLGITYIPFSCPDAMVAIVADFILSLIEVEVSVVYCERPDGLKFSVRSERRDVDAGALAAQALEGIGDGGGHAYMAGGKIPAHDVSKLGKFRNNIITERFIKALGLDI